MEDALIIVGDKGPLQTKIIWCIIGSASLSLIQSIAFAFLTKKPNFLCKINDDLNSIYHECEYNKQLFCSNPSTITYKKDPSKSIINLTYSFDLICDRESYIPLIGSVFFFGSILGCITLSSLPDKFGRKRIFQFLLCLSCISNILCLFSFNPTQLLLIIFISGFTSFVYGMSSIMVSEYVARDISGIIMGLVNSMYPVTGILISIFFYFFKNWRILFFVASIPFCLLSYWSLIYMVESVRWLNSQGKTEEIISTLDQIAKINNTEKEWNDYKPKMEQFLQKNTKKTSKGNSQINLSIIEILQLKSQQKKIFLLSIIWFITAFYFYGIILNLEHLGGNIYVDSIMAFAAEMISEMSSGWLSNIFGRIIIMRYGSYLGAIGFFLFTFFDFSIVIKSFLIFLTTFGFAAIFNVIYIYSPEVIPTPIRGMVCSSLFLLSRLGACIVAPISSLVGNYINYLFSLAGIITAGITYFLDESLGEPIIDEIPEFEGMASFKSGKVESNEMNSIIDRGPVSSKYFISDIFRKYN